MKTTSRCFTLLEILLAIAILATVAGFTGWGASQMVAEYRFNQTVKTFVSDLKKHQLLCLAKQIDMELCFIEKKGRLRYFFESDEPMAPFFTKSKSLKGVRAISPVKDSSKIPLYSCGRIGKEITKLSLSKNQTKGVMVEFDTPLLIVVKEQSSVKKI